MELLQFLILVCDEILHDVRQSSEDLFVLSREDPTEGNQSPIISVSAVGIRALKDLQILVEVKSLRFSLEETLATTNRLVCTPRQAGPCLKYRPYLDVRRGYNIREIIVERGLHHLREGLASVIHLQFTSLLVLREAIVQPYLELVLANLAYDCVSVEGNANLE